MIKLRPQETDAQISLAVLSARLGDLGAYRSACAAFVATIGKRGSPTNDVATVHLATLRPDGLADPDAVLKILMPNTKFFQSNPRMLGALAFVQYRAGHLEAARLSARKSIIAYAGRGRLPQLPGRKAQPDPQPEDVSPRRDDGTPREWLLMALVEARLGHAVAAAAWRDKAVGWLDRANMDPTHPDLLGAMNSFAERHENPAGAAWPALGRVSLRLREDEVLPPDLAAIARARPAP